MTPHPGRCPVERPGVATAAVVTRKAARLRDRARPRDQRLLLEGEVAGHPGAHVRVNSRDEFGVLAHHFNEMLARIEDFNSELQARVKEATSELERRYHEVQRMQRSTGRRAAWKRRRAASG